MWEALVSLPSTSFFVLYCFVLKEVAGTSGSRL
jgi:hypothetical protein